MASKNNDEKQVTVVEEQVKEITTVTTIITELNSVPFEAKSRIIKSVIAFYGLDGEISL